MCPEPQTLSAYIDGEVSAQWAKAIETHISACSSCQKKLLSLQSIRDTLSRVESLEYRGLMKKVWNRIREYRQKAAVSPVPIFKRSLSVPLPIAALAAVLIVLLGFSAVYYLARGDFHILKLTTEPSGIMEMRVASPIEDLEVILKSLESREFKKETVIQLPTNSQFFILGEPVLIRADELKRSYAR